MIEVIEVKNVPVCADGCCHDDGLMIYNKSNDMSDYYFYPSSDIFETRRILNLMGHLFGDDNVEFIQKK